MNGKLADRYPGLKVVPRTLAGGTRTQYYYDRKTGNRVVGAPFTAEFDLNYLKTTGRKAIAGPGEVEQSAPAETIRGLWQAFRQDVDYKRLSDSYRRDLHRHMETWLEQIGDERVDAIRRAHVMAMRDAFIDTPRTAKHKVQTLSRLMTFAVDREIIEINPAARVKVELSPRDQIWQADDLGLFIEKANPWVSAVVIFALLSGQRQEDCLTFERKALEQDPDCFKLKQSKRDVIVRIDYREIPEMKEFLDAWMEFSPECMDGTVFHGQRGNAWTPSGFRTEMTKAKLICQSERIDTLAFLDLRRTCTVELALAGWPIRSIGQVTGHADSSILEILKTYMPRGVLLHEQGARKERGRVEIIADVAYQKNYRRSLTTAWLTAVANWPHRMTNQGD